MAFQDEVKDGENGELGFVVATSYLLEQLVGPAGEGRFSNPMASCS